MGSKRNVCLHHVEICVENEDHILKHIKNGFGFRQSLYRKSPEGQQWVLNSGKTHFIITVKNHGKDSDLKNEELSETHDSYPVLTCCGKNKHIRDAVFNIALEVQCLSKIVDKIKDGSIENMIIKDVHTIKDEHGSIQIAVVYSKCASVIHTLLDKTQYTGVFLPGFAHYNMEVVSNIPLDPVKNLNEFKRLQKLYTESVDHVTYVCHAGDSGSIIKWYEECFGMKRFLINKDETDDGFVLNEGIGLRLKALQYWECAETGVAPSSNVGEDDILRIVIAEPLLHVENSHVATFLKENSGPGIQHIGLSTSSIIDCVKELQVNGVQFRKPPPTYYDECGKLNEICDVGLAHQLGELRNCGILLDAESDAIIDVNQDNKRYLMQIFTFPVFKANTFFLEVIQRCGATGFGSGNITALARSIIRFQEEEEEKKKL